MEVTIAKGEARKAGRGQIVEPCCQAKEFEFVLKAVKTFGNGRIRFTFHKISGATCNKEVRDGKLKSGRLFKGLIIITTN